MGVILVPNSNGHSETLKEFNPNHEPGGSAKGGQFASKKGGGGAGSKGGYQRPEVIRTGNIDEAIGHILAGRVVELTDVRHVNTVLTKLAAMATEAERLGGKAPIYDLCKVSVAKTNLFCASKVTTPEYPEGVARINMPQLAGLPLSGTAADKLQRNPKGEVNASSAFIAHLRDELGIKVAPDTVAAASLKASQSELVGAKVAGMMSAKTYDPAEAPIFVSRDGYVVDGHHRWAAVVGRDAANGHLGDLRMNVLKIDAPISEVLKLANAFTKSFGIAPAEGPSKRMVPTVPAKKPAFSDKGTSIDKFKMAPPSADERAWRAVQQAKKGKRR